MPKLAYLLSAAFAAQDAHGRCIAACSMMTRMLDLLHVWSFGLFGSVVIEAPDRGLRRTMQTIAFKRDPDLDAAAGHAWVCAPPFLLVDTTLALQRWDSAILPLVPDVILADAAAPRVHARVEDCVDDRVRDLFAETEGWHDPYLHHRLDPSLRGFHQTFPARDVITPKLHMRFVPVLIRQPCETLAEIEVKRGGPSGATIWNSIVAPAFGMVPCHMGGDERGQYSGRSVARSRPGCHRRAMTQILADTVLRVIERAPQWIRRDLDSKDAIVRIRAEESLAAMIADALDSQAVGG
ncbi:MULTISPECIES: hypothetical protein [unclassified Sphingopyxis]|uniref:hypothetical protein n=1 Tax=unclassified Sphingopyxis TaxID=2614943 RepID=UPI0012E38881|nr:MULTISPECIES: hypothetical protein [unclassified Sphingopyxis]